MINFAEVPALSFEVHGQRTEGYLDNPRVISAVERLNTIGLHGILDSIRYFRVDEESMPLSVINPLSERADEPLGEFEDGIVLRTFGAANGHRVIGQQVLSALWAEITGIPVVSVPLPDRDWDGSNVIDQTKPWAKLSPLQKRRQGIAHLDEYAIHGIESVDKLLFEEKGQGKIVFAGDSIGAAVALSLAYKAANFDRGGVAITALPNNEERKLYRQLFFRDFMKSNEGMCSQVTAGNPTLAPFIEAQGYQDGPKSDFEEMKAGAPYLLRDLFGLMPVDPRMKIYKSNRANTRSLTVPTSIEMIERLNGVNIFAAFFKKDLVARPDAFRRLAAQRTRPKHAEFYMFDGSHTATNNPYIIGHMATKLV